MASYSCRFCCTLLDAQHSYSLFSKVCSGKNVAERFRNLLELPVSPTDGLSMYYCRACFSRLTRVEKTLEEMRSLARSSYSKARSSSQVTATSPVHRPGTTPVGQEPHHTLLRVGQWLSVGLGED